MAVANLRQVVAFESWHSHAAWARLNEKGLELVDERGQQQFDFDRGGQLYMQIRTPIVSNPLDFCHY